MKKLELVHITFYPSNNIEVAFHRKGMNEVVFFYPCQPKKLKRLLTAANRMGLQAELASGNLWIWIGGEKKTKVVFDVKIPKEIWNPPGRVGSWKQVATLGTRPEAEDYLWIAWGILPEWTHIFIDERKEVE